MKTDTELQRDVLDELLWDPSISATNLQVTADHRTVTLSGSIASYTEKWAAKRATQRVRGVDSVVNNLKVRLPPEDERTDADLAGMASDTLRWNRLVPHELISVVAAHGLLTLKGVVPYHYQREAAYNAVRTLVGVTDVNNHLRIKPSVTAGAVKKQIEKALVRSAETDAGSIQVSTHGNTVTLSGKVHSWSERDAVAATPLRVDQGHGNRARSDQYCSGALRQVSQVLAQGAIDGNMQRPDVAAQLLDGDGSA
jgi:osmotically-inducible protein OsmY